jgi:transcriptional regulator with XRE-family HTH domain
MTSAPQKLYPTLDTDGEPDGTVEVDAAAADLQIGARVHYARVLKGLRMRDLAKKVNCTESMISKIESNRVVPSIAMLQKIIVALDRNMASFFGLELDTHKLVQRPEERVFVKSDALRGGHGISYERLVPPAAGNLLEANIHVILPGGHKTDQIKHQGEAVGYLLEGEIELDIDGTTYRMSAGDSFFFKAHLKNGYRNVGAGTARLLWVNTPQVH